MNYGITKQHIHKNEKSRCGRIRPYTKGIGLHWTANAGTNAFHTGAYFDAAYRYASTQYGIDNTHILQYMYDNEVAYSIGHNEYTEYAIKKFGYYCEHPKRTSPNDVTINIELHHPEWNGKPYPGAIQRCIWFVARLCVMHSLNPLTDVFRHYDIYDKKDCPRYYVNNPDQWKFLLSKINIEYEKQFEESRMGLWNPGKEYKLLIA